jgi:hypothetical protein
MVEKHEEDISSSDSNSTEIPIPLEDLSLNKNSQISQDADWDPGHAITPGVKEQKKFQPIS